MKTFDDRRVLIVGGGLGALSAAIYLRLKGFRVTLLEACERVGGRANLIERKGFRFDTGPSLLNYPWVFEELFAAAGRRLRGLRREPVHCHRNRQGDKSQHPASSIHLVLHAHGARQKDIAD